MNNLPKVYANKIDDVINNNDYYYRGNEEKKDISELRGYFDKNGYANKLKVNLVTKDSSRDEVLILYKNDYVININNKKIYLKDIIDFKIK